MKKFFFNVFVALCTLSAYAGDHVIVVRSDDLGHKQQTEVTIDNDGNTEIINVITGDVLKVMVKDIYGHVIYSFLMTAEEDAGYPVYIPALSFGWHAEIWVNNQLVYTIYE